MSQEKVDKYKAEKANRKKEVAKKKMQKKLYVVLGALLGVALVAWIGVSVYLEIKADREYESKVKEQSEALSQWLEDYYATSTLATTGETGTGDETTSADETGTGDETTSAGETETGDETTSAGEETSSEEETTTSATE